jgi:N-acetylglucosaminyl-diphospho-decaprenol L-rhamnosyltransferase
MLNESVEGDRREENAVDVDVVVVSYESRAELPGCVEPLSTDPRLSVIVVDNASQDGSLESVRKLPITTVALEHNGGFAHGCNEGWRRGSAPLVLFLNPDARTTPHAIERLAETVRTFAAGAAAPRVLNADGQLDFSLRRFPRLRSTYAQALFLHRVWPSAAWTDQLIRTPDAYATAHPVDWVSGVCILIRRDVLEEIGGWDEGFFMYREDTDICKRIHQAGYEIRYEPSAVVEHRGGASAPRSTLLPTLAASRVRYANKHSRLPAYLLERGGIMLSAATHMVVGRGGRARRSGHARALAVAAGVAQPTRPNQSDSPVSTNDGPAHS